MKAAIISLKSTSSCMIEDALKKYFEKVDHINLKDMEIRLENDGAGLMVLGKPLPTYDCVYIRGSFRYLFIMRAIASILPDTSYLPTPHNLLTVSHDKLLTQLALFQHKIPMPATYVAPTIDAAKSILKKMKYPIVFKFPAGTHGKGVMTADSYASASSMIDAFDALNQSIIIQEYIESQGTDIRVIVIGDTIAACMKRTAQDGEKRANMHAGASAKTYKPSKEVQALALKVAKMLGADICAIDIIEGTAGPMVLEVNISPGIGAITRTTGVDVANLMAKHLYDQTKKHMGGHLHINADGMYEIFSALSLVDGEMNIPEGITKITEFKDGADVSILAKRHMLVITQDPGKKGSK